MNIKGSGELGDLEMQSTEGNMEAVVDAEIGEDFKNRDDVMELLNAYKPY